MRYTVTSEFTKLNETGGTIQNISQIYTLEVSSYRTKDSGILVYPLNSITFSGSPVYVRCVDTNGFIDVRVATFTVGGASSLPVEPDNPNVVIIDGVPYTVESGANMDSVTDSIFNDNINPVATDEEINAALDNIFSGGGGQTSSGDTDFDSSLDDIFG